MPDSNLYQGDVVTFICMGDVGNNPVGTLGWYFYIQGDGTSVQNFTSLATPGSVHSNKTCSMTAVSMLTFKITEQMREFVVRCTVTQGAPFTMTGLGYKETPVLKVKERRAMEKVESSTSTGLTIVITLLVIGVLVIVTIQFLRRHYYFQFSRKDAGNHAEVANVSVTSVADGEAEVASSTYYSEPTVVPLQTSSAHSVSHQSMSEYTWQESL